MAQMQSLLVAALAVVFLSLLPALFNHVEAKFGFSGMGADVFADKRSSLIPERRPVFQGDGLISRLVAGDPCLIGAEFDSHGKPCSSSAVPRLGGTLRVGHHPPGVGGHNPRKRPPPAPTGSPPVVLPDDFDRIIGHHPPGVGHHPPGVGHHPPGVGHHPPGVGHHPPGVGHHPPGVGHHPPRVGKSPPPAKSPPAKSPPAKSPPAKSPPAKSPPAKSPPAKSPPAKSPPAKSPPGGKQPPGVGKHPPGVGKHPPGVGHHPPGVGHHPPGVGHHPPGRGKRCHKNKTRCLDPTYNPRLLIDPTATTCCSKSCVSVINDFRACGGCGRTCGTSTDGIAHGCCDGKCVDLFDVNTCGGCFPCAPGQICIEGVCTNYQ